MTEDSEKAERPRSASIRRVTELYGLSRSTIYKLLKSDAFKAVKVGTRTLVDLDSFERWYETRPPYGK